MVRGPGIKAGQVKKVSPREGYVNILLLAWTFLSVI